MVRQFGELARSNADLEELAYTTSHDLQEPLRNIAVFSQFFSVRYAGRLHRDADEIISIITSAPQTPDVAPEVAPSKDKATREKKAPKTGNGGAPRDGSKTSQVIAMLKSEGGVTLEEIMTAKGWQKHTTRAMLSAGGSLTKNHELTVISEKVGEHRRYSIKG